MAKFVPAALIVAAVTVTVGCARVETEEARGSVGDPVSIVATTGMIADAAAAVGGAEADVTALMGPGIDPHVYKASEGDVQLLVDSDLVLFNGLHLEAKLADVLERLGDRAVAVSDGIPR